MGPLVSEEQLYRVMGYLNYQAAEEGAKPIVGGGPCRGRSYLVQPTVSSVNAKPNMKVIQEEILGPVAHAVPFTDPMEVVQATNRGVFGLASAIWTRDLSKAHRLAAKLHPRGTVWVNCYNIFDAALPFGGYRQIRLGPRDGRRSAPELHRDESGLHPVRGLPWEWLGLEN